MSLIGFHKVLISSAIVFCALFSGWEVARFQEDASGGRLVLAIVFALLAAGLAVYLALLKRILSKKDSV